MFIPAKHDNFILLTALALVIGAYMAIDHPTAAQRLPFVTEISQPQTPAIQLAFTKLGK